MITWWGILLGSPTGGGEGVYNVYYMGRMYARPNEKKSVSGNFFSF